MGYNIPEIETLLKYGIPIGTVFDIIIKNPYVYCSPDLADAISKNTIEYKSQIDSLKLKEGYSLHLHGRSVLNNLFTKGFPESLLTKYVVYPITYQFKTDMPFIDHIKVTDKFPKFKICSSPIIEEFLGQTYIDRGSLSFPVVRYGVKGGGVVYSGETPQDICGTFYYSEAKSDVLLKFDSCLVVPNKIVAYHYLFDVDIANIRTDLIGLDESSYIEEPLLFMDKKCGFASYYFDFDINDIDIVYDMIKDNLTETLDNIKALMYDSNILWRPQEYFDELTKEIIDDKVHYVYRKEIQNIDLILFMIMYMKYTTIKMMIDSTWNWRVSIFHPYTFYDQLICNKAYDMGIDVIILTTEVSTGMYPIRSEIIDTRPRDISYANLRIKNKHRVARLRNYEKQEINFL